MTIFSVKTAAQLHAALDQAIGGDRIVLSPGDYGSVSIQNRSYATPVTIQTSTPSNRAHLDGLFVSKSNNLTFTGLDLGRALTPTETWKTTHLNTVKDSSNIRFAGVQFHGSIDNDYSNDGSGLTATNVTNLRVDNSHFTELFRGLNLQRVTGVTVSSNTFDGMRSDGITAAAVDKIMIERNSFTDFRPITGDHADGIQFWNTSQVKGSSNITIRNNVIAPGSDDFAVQGIFISDPLTFGFHNLQITNNLVYTHGAYHGINVDGGVGLNISGNSVFSQTGDAKKAWIRAGDSSKVVVEDNVTDDILLINVTDLTQSNNLDFSLDSSLRALIPNLNAPQTLMDLIVPDVGFQGIPMASAAQTTLTGAADAYVGGAVLPGSGLEWQMNSFVALP